jgi:RecB family exonuclease
MGFLMAYSYSSIKAFKNCQRQYYETKILKKWPFPETDAIMYGKDVHKALEDYIGENKPLGPHTRFQPVADSIIALDGEKLTEFEMALDDNLNPCEFLGKDVFIRGIADIVVVDKEKKRAYIGDYKTGSAKYPDTDQLELMALMIFRYFPEVEHVKAALLFIVHDKVVTAEYHKKDAKPKWIQWLAKVETMEQAAAMNMYHENPTGLCGWCEVTTCPHNTKDRRIRKAKYA